VVVCGINECEAGLGLSICNEVVVAHKCRVGVEKDVKVGGVRLKLAQYLTPTKAPFTGDDGGGNE